MRFPRSDGVSCGLRELIGIVDIPAAALADLVAHRQLEAALRAAAARLAPLDAGRTPAEISHALTQVVSNLQRLLMGHPLPC